MKLAMFREGGRDRLGVVEADTVIDVTGPAGLVGRSGGLAAGAGDLVAHAGAVGARSHGAPAAVRRCRRCGGRRRSAIGGNYASHLREIAHLNVSAGEHQIWFNKQASCITGPFDELVIPRACRRWITRWNWRWSSAGAAATCGRATPSITSPDTPSAMTPASASAITAARPSRWRNHSILWGPWGRGWSRPTRSPIRTRCESAPGSTASCGRTAIRRRCASTSSSRSRS